jgi:hypothetical protein
MSLKSGNICAFDEVPELDCSIMGTRDQLICIDWVERKCFYRVGVSLVEGFGGIYIAIVPVLFIRLLVKRKVV